MNEIDMDTPFRFVKKDLPDDIYKDRRIYPFHIDFRIRYQDIDTLGHINNVAMAGMFEDTCVKFFESFVGQDEMLKGRVVLGESQLFYLAEAFYGEPVRVFLGAGYIGTTSWRVHAAAYQEDRCVVLGNASFINIVGKNVAPIPDKFKRILREKQIKPV